QYPMTTAAAPPESPSTPAVRMSPRQHLALSAFWFANSLHWGALATIVIENQAARIHSAVPTTPDKAVLTGWVFGLGAIVAALTPPIVGAFSDRSRSPLGRRRPFVISGTLIN